MSEAAVTRHVRLQKRKENTQIFAQFSNSSKSQEPQNVPKDFEMGKYYSKKISSNITKSIQK